jgi:anaerobic selenocysteine-containing dehydrogenase
MRKRQPYQPMPTSTNVSRREFVKVGAASAVAGGIVLGVPAMSDAQQAAIPAPPETNIDDFMTDTRCPGRSPGAWLR